MPWTPERLRIEARRDVERNPRLRLGNRVRYRAYDGDLVGASGRIAEVDPERPGPPFFVRFADDLEGWYWWAELQTVA